MPTEFTHRAAVRAYNLLAASAFTDPDTRAFAGVTIAPHGKCHGVLLTATTGAQMAFVYEASGSLAGRPTTWRIHHPWLEAELAKVPRAQVDPDNLWAVLNWSETGVPVCHVTLMNARTGEDALQGHGKKLKTVQRDNTDLVITGQVPDLRDAIAKATTADRSLAPSAWVYPAGLERVERMARALHEDHDGDIVAVCILRTDRSNIVQVAFRDHPEAAAFLVTIREYGSMNTENPPWLDALL